MGSMIDDEEPFNPSTTELHRAMSALAHWLPCGMVLVNADGVILDANEQMLTCTGVDVRSFLGQRLVQTRPEGWQGLESILDRVHGGERVVDEVVFDVPATAGVSSSTEPRTSTWHRRCRVEYFPVFDDGRFVAAGIMVIDLTDVAVMPNEQRNLATHYEVLRAVAQACARSASAEDLYESLVEIAVTIDEIDMAWIGIREDGEIRKGPACGIDDGYLNELVVNAMEGDEHSRGPTGQAVLSGNATVIGDFTSAPTTKPWHELAARVGFQSVGAFPLKCEGRVVAVLSTYSRTLRGYSETTVDTLNGIRPLVGLALEHFEVRRENSMSRDLLLMRDGALGTISQGIVITDARVSDHPIIYASPSFLQLTGYAQQEVLGRNCRFLQGPESDPEVVSAIRDAVAAGRGVEVELLNYKRTGEAFWNHLALSPVFDEHGVLARFVGVQSDVTERRNLESQLIQSHRLEAVGTLAGGVAHDFNNLLLVMQGYASVLLRELEPGSHRDMVERIHDAVERGAELTRQLLAYTRQQTNRPSNEDLNHLISEAITTVDGVVGAGVRLETQLASGLASVYVDPPQVRQVVVSLLANARDAMPTGGTLTIRTAMTTLDETFALRHGEVAPGEYVMMEVVDTGVGMSRETLARAFEPFFTTKEIGSGLGLSSVMGVVRQNQGYVNAYSEEGIGTTIRVYFPAGQALADERTTPITPSSEEDVDVNGTETVLVVEDDDEVRHLVVAALSEMGYHVLAAGSGRDGLSISRNTESAIDVLVTDVVMPEMNGREFAELIVQERPSLKVIFTSGYPSTVLRDRDYVDESTVFIDKPYSSRMVARAIRTLMDV